jgi:zinc protease
MPSRFSSSHASRRLALLAASLPLLALSGGAAPSQPGSAPKAPATAAAPKSKIPTIKFEQYTLSNGLRVILAPDKNAPVVAVSVTYDVGSRNEREGRTGFAHLFEHMMFQGSQNVGKGEHIFLIQNSGGSFNGTTNQDRTNYFETLPANQLELGLFLESDRMRGLDVSQENLDNQRSVVQEERRQNYDNRAYGQSFEAMLDLAYGNFAYKHSTIGSMADLNAATLEDVRSFFKTYYAPNRAVLALVGDFDKKQAKQLIEKYFGPIARQPEPPKVDVAEPLAFSGERRKTINDSLARQPQWVAGYITVPGDHPDFYPLAALGEVLSGGRNSRFYQTLVEKNIALRASARPSEGRGSALFSISVTLPPDNDPADAEKIVDAEIVRVQESGITAEELERFKASARASAASSYGTALGKANALSMYAVYFNDPNRVNNELGKQEAVTAADIQRVAKKYLVKENRAIVLTLPLRSGTPSAAAPRTSQETNAK